MSIFLKVAAIRNRGRARNARPIMRATRCSPQNDRPHLAIGPSRRSNLRCDSVG
jgi:hypothetical protein